MTTQHPSSSTIHSYCYYHPQHTLHNFCSNPQCSLPLCPKCINIHLTQYSNLQHHIQPITQTKQMIEQQLETSIQAINAQLSSIQQQNCLKQYSTLLRQYREQAIQAINQHYDQIENQISRQLKSKYNCHLSALVRPLEDRKREIQAYKKALKEKPIQCMIKVVSQDFILSVEKFLMHLDTQKGNFKRQLPRLQGIEGNMVKVVPGGGIGVGAKIYQQKHSQSQQYNQARSRRRQQENSMLSQRYYNGINDSVIDHFGLGTGTERIQQLQDRLFHLRHHQQG